MRNRESTASTFERVNLGFKKQKEKTKKKKLVEFFLRRIVGMEAEVLQHKAQPLEQLMKGTKYPLDQHN